MIGRRRWISSMNSTSPCAQIGERADKVAGLLEGRSGLGVDVGADFARNELGQRRLAKPRRSEKQRVIQRLASHERRVDVDAQRSL